MKAYTDLEQSKKLAEILPIESADMFYVYDRHLDKLYGDTPYVIGYKVLNENADIPCWSLAALLEITRNNGRYEMQMYEGGYYFEANGFMTESYFNPIDACYEMILKLNELNLL